MNAQTSGQSAKPNESRFAFCTANGPIGALVIQHGVWSLDPNPLAMIVAYPPMYDGLSEPNEETSLKLLELAEHVCGMKLDYNKKRPWLPYGDKQIRVLSIRTRSTTKLLTLLDPKAQA